MITATINKKTGAAVPPLLEMMDVQRESAKHASKPFFAFDTLEKELKEINKGLSAITDYGDISPAEAAIELEIVFPIFMLYNNVLKQMKAIPEETLVYKAQHRKILIQLSETRNHLAEMAEALELYADENLIRKLDKIAGK